jgi:hypothetical protein
MASRIATALQPGVGEQVLVRFDPGVLVGFPAVLEETLTGRGAEVASIAYGPVADFDQRLRNTDVYIWLPTNDPLPHSEGQTEALGHWLDSGRGRQIHFHWGGGTVDTDGLAGVHSAAYDAVYAEALEIDYGEMDRQQEAAIALLRSGMVHVTTPGGTDIQFRVVDEFGIDERPFNKQNGDASGARMISARTRIDREIELPAGVIRVAPIEETVSGTIAVPWARFGDVEVRDLRLEFRQGQISTLSAREGEAAVRANFEALPALKHFREFGLGFNPALVVPTGGTWLPYYGYGAGVVRLSLGNNFEVGGQVGGTGSRWFFFPDATVDVAGTALVVGGQLVTPPSSLDATVMRALTALRLKTLGSRLGNASLGGLLAANNSRVPDAVGRVVYVYGDIVTIELSPDSPGIEEAMAVFAIHEGGQYKGEVVVAAIRERTLFCLEATTVEGARMSVGDGAAVNPRDR